ncbi:MAG: phosphoenolpyruvate synthase/pyruvate phosphate dikinase [Candidatus Promineifilaceae bacterium]|jgi:phosphoenolpyruvate synthase/pyruvate phosphate dikinase
MSSYILPFSEIDASKIGDVGGKGANLGELTQAGFNVPSGFCVTTTAFTRFMAEAPADIYSYLDQDGINDLDVLRQVGKTIRDQLNKISLPVDVEEALIRAWKDSGEQFAYAVRSSATAEDLPHASFAGQQDTYLNVRGADDLIIKVKACFISLFTDRAILYRVQNKFDHRQVALSVVVQQMVQPEVAGILFTADPITGNRHITSIDASFGLGEALVSGLVSADLYQVDKRTNHVIKRQIASKQLAIRSLPEGGTEQIQLGPDERDRPALNDVQLITLSKMGCKIESHYSKPQDIEWALVGDTFYITQSRPITSLYPLPQPLPADDALHVYTSLSHFQVMTDAMPPLAASMLGAFIPVGRDTGHVESKFVLHAGGRVYVDLSPLLRHRLVGKLLIKAYKSADPLAQSGLKELMTRPNFQVTGDRFPLFSVIPGALPFLRKVIGMIFWMEPEEIPTTASNLILTHVAQVKAELDQADDVAAKLKIVVAELHGAINPILTWAPYMVSGQAAAGLLSSLIGRWAEPDDLAALERGLTGNVTTEMNLAVGDLTDAARHPKALKELLSHLDISAKERLVRAAELPGGAEFLEVWNNFIQLYGARALSEIDLSRPRWSEDPTALLQMVVNGLGHGEPGGHRQHFQHLKQLGDRSAEKLLKQAQSGWMGWLRGPLVRRLMRVSRNLTPIREHHKFMVIQLFSMFKQVFLDAGRQLAEEGALSRVEDVWFLNLTELLEAIDQPDRDWLALVNERQEAFERYQDMTPPRVITSEGEIPVAKLDGGNAPEGALIGSPVSAGVVEGIVRVILDPSIESLIPGEILVTPFTDPGWTPLFVNAAGLITEVGGLMTHGSVVAREYGIPAVVGVIDATKQLKTGQRVRVHGDVGYIELLD